MIVTRLMGGLGNQMFQYAIARRLALKRDVEVVLDLSWLEGDGRTAHTVRNYELGCFNLDARVVTTADAVEGTGRLMRRRKPKLAILEEQYCSYDSRVLQAPASCLLVGYWQSEKYFRDIARQIREDFAVDTPFADDIQAIADKIMTSDAVSIHVRRGDFAAVPYTNEIHGLLDVDYYRRGLHVIERHVAVPRIFVFSDDPAWCQRNMHFDHPTTVVDRGEQVDDLRLMSLCRHHIIANSTFGWWGAWLDPNPDKVVVAPRRWFRDPTRDVRDIIPHSWIKL